MGNYTILSESDGTWQAFCDQWDNECKEHNEEFENFAEGTFSIINNLIANPEPLAAVAGIQQNDKYIAICQINTKLIKGYEEPVLRVRHLTLAPEYDFTNVSVQQYAKSIVACFFGIYHISNEHEKLKANHIKFHLPSSSDQQFFGALGEGLNDRDGFKSVQSKGAWLYVTKE